jgi:CubicO group peptidase (beta-lactamase class C family)
MDWGTCTGKQRFSGRDRSNGGAGLTGTPLIPDTPAGLILASFFAAYNRGDQEWVRNFISTHYADPNADHGPDEDILVWNSLDYTTFLVMGLEHDPACGLHLHSIEVSQPDQVAVLAQCGLAGEWVYIKAKVTADPPHHLIQFRTRPALRLPISSVSGMLTDAGLALKLDTFIGRLHDAGIFAGTICVARNEHPVYERAFGLASREFEVSNRIDTKFNIGSLNKMFTAVAIAQLVEQGKLTYSDTLAQHLPEYSNPAANQITIHHMLTHLSGIGSYWNEAFKRDRAHIRSVSDFMRLFIHEPLVNSPGKRWYYSNGGYVVLGAIIERITGTDYYDYVRREVFEPSGMHNTDAYEVDKPVPNLAVGYTHIAYDGRRELGNVHNNFFMHVVKGGPGGGGFSTVQDLVGFGAALRANTLIQSQSMKWLTRGKVNLRGNELRYAYGFNDRRINGQHIVGHHGNFPGIGAQFDFYLDSGTTVTILSNTDPSAAQIIIDYLRNVLTQAG